MAETRTIRVVIVDDHPVVRFGLAAIIGLQPDMVVAGEAESGEDACSLCDSHPADVVLIDLRLPGMSGVATIQAIRQVHPEIRFVVLTVYDRDEDIRRALEAGAQGYLLKAMPHSTLVRAIRAVHAGLRYIPPSISERLANRPPKAELSARELEVLELIVKGRSNREIGETLGICESTVKWHVNVMLSRLGVSDRTQAAVAALERGIANLW